VTEDSYLAGGGRQQTLENFDRSCLPCSIRAQQAEALPSLDVETQPADGLDFAVISLSQIAAMAVTLSNFSEVMGSRVMTTQRFVVSPRKFHLQ